jgi:1-deoxy-D-xylulose-5-phosphate reductoisomerase
MMKRKVAVLGATGSLGKSAVDVLRRGRDSFDPVLFTAHRNGEALFRLKKEFPGAALALSGTEAPVSGIAFTGRRGLLEAVGSSGADIAVNGIAGAGGLEPSLACIEAGIDLALANKETVVMAGPLVFRAAAEKGVHIIPVDSEHSAIFKLIEAHGRENVAGIVLTASGGPFRNFPSEKLAGITPEEALVHPTWSMGAKITVDSATLGNKGLEVIEAVRLFGFPPETVQVVVHPQSIVHSMVKLKDGAVYAQMSRPDMRLPIHEALYWPETAPSPFGVLDFGGLALSFENPDTRRFPMLALAYEACRRGPLCPAAYNAANEEAVAAFLGGKAGFLEIPRIVEYVINRDFQGSFDTGPGEREFTIGEVLEADKKARELAREFIRGNDADR